MSLKEIVDWLNVETSCYAQDESRGGNLAILVDGVLYPKEIYELALRLVLLERGKEDVQENPS